jgi:hypothetical protein
MEAITLSEYYKRKLQTICEMISAITFKDNANPEYIRLSAKASCYKTLIAELECEMANDL